MLALVIKKEDPNPFFCFDSIKVAPLRELLPSYSAKRNSKLSLTSWQRLESERRVQVNKPGKPRFVLGSSKTLSLLVVPPPHAFLLIFSFLVHR